MAKLMRKDFLARKSVIIADFDGTLVHLDADWQLLRSDLQRYCREKFDIHQSFERLDEGLFTIKRLLGERAFSDLLEIVTIGELKGYHGRKIDPVIQALSSASAIKKLAVFSSNCRKTIESIIPDLGLSISYIVAKDDVKEPKPSGEGIIQILKHFNASAAEAIFLGDSRMDLQAGQAAGVLTMLWRDALE